MAKFYVEGLVRIPCSTFEKARAEGKKLAFGYDIYVLEGKRPGGVRYIENSEGREWWGLSASEWDKLSFAGKLKVTNRELYDDVMAELMRDYEREEEKNG